MLIDLVICTFQILSTNIANNAMAIVFFFDNMLCFQSNLTLTSTTIFLTLVQGWVGGQTKKEQTGAKLGQAQLKLKLGSTSIKISCIKLMTRLCETFNGNSKMDRGSQKNCTP